MEAIFELITAGTKEKGEGRQCCLGIRVKVAGVETVCPITRARDSYEAFELEVQKVRKGLDQIIGRAKEMFEKPSEEDLASTASRMKAEEVWAILSNIADNDVFVGTFNSLEEAKRREVAEHVLTKCNIFSGKAAVFSARYADNTALME